MAIEIRQLTIKSFVSAPDEREKGSFSEQERKRLKDEILSECRQMLLHLMRSERER